MPDPARNARLRMAAAFVASTATVVATLAVLLFALLLRQRSNELNTDLRNAALETVNAAAVIGAEQLSPRAVAIEAVDELDSREIPLFLFDATGAAIGAGAPPPAVRSAARRALGQGVVQGAFESNGQTWRLAAQAFRVRAVPFAVVAVADESSLDSKYLALVQLFGVAAAVAILLLGISSYYFAGRAIRPIQANAEATRRFMADAAHELRTPVAALRAQAEAALGSTDLSPAGARALRTIAAESTRLSATLADLLTLARADTGERRPRRETFFLDDLVSDATAAMSALARQRNVSLAQGRYEQARVNGDVQLIRQLLSILLDNAIKYTPAGATVLTHVYTEAQQPVLEVQDNGMGIAAADRDRIFERFFRSEGARALAEGAGLGLSIARWIAEVHAARIDVSATPGGGSCFRVRFPPAV